MESSKDCQLQSDLLIPPLEVTFSAPKKVTYGFKRGHFEEPQALGFPPSFLLIHESSLRVEPWNPYSGENAAFVSVMLVNIPDMAHKGR